MKIDFKINPKYTKENYPILECLPSSGIEYNAKKTAVALAKNYRYKTVILYSEASIENIEFLKRILDKNELFIIKDKKNNILEWHYQYKYQKDIPHSLGGNLSDSIKMVHKTSNAPKKVKIARMLGENRALAFKLRSSNIKVVSWNNESKKYNKHM